MDHRLGVDLPPEQGHQRLDIPGRGDQQDAVAAMKRRRSVSQFGASAAAADARNDEIPQRKVPDLGDGLAVDGGIDDLDGKTPGRQVFLRVRILPGGGLFAFHVDAQQVAKPDQREDGSHDAQRVGHGVPRGDVRGIGSGVHVAESLLCGAQSGRVGHGARHHADHRRHGQARDVIERHRRGDTQRHHQHRQFVERDAALAERGEKSGSDLQADRIDEKNQSELLEKMHQVFIDVHAEIAEADADEQNARHAQRHAGDLEFAQHDTQRHDQRQNQHRVGHTSAPKRLGAK